MMLMVIEKLLFYLLIFTRWRSVQQLNVIILAQEQAGDNYGGVELDDSVAG